MPFQGGSRVNLASIDATIATLGTLSVTGNADITGTLAQHGQATFDVTPKVGAVSLVKSDDARLITPGWSDIALVLNNSIPIMGSTSTANCFGRIKTDGKHVWIQARLENTGNNGANSRVYLAPGPPAPKQFNSDNRYMNACAFGRFNGGAATGFGLQWSNADGVWLVADFNTALSQVTTPSVAGDYFFFRMDYEIP